MKVVLFCGGFGMRLREYSEIDSQADGATIGYRPILWHVMKYYAHFGHKDFILCLGWKADIIKRLFPQLQRVRLERLRALLRRDASASCFSSDIDDWKITFVDTGTTSNIGAAAQGGRAALGRRRDLPGQLYRRPDRRALPALIDYFHQRKAVATFLSVRPPQSFHAVTSDDDGTVRRGAGDQRRRRVDERRLLRAQSQDLRLPAGRRGAGRRTVRAADRHRQAVRLQVRRILGLHGHLQRKAAARRHVLQRKRAVGGLEKRSPRGSLANADGHVGPADQAQPSGPRPHARRPSKHSGPVGRASPAQARGPINVTRRTTGTNDNNRSSGRNAMRVASQ